MQKPATPAKHVQVIALGVIVAVSATIFGCRGERPSASPAASATNQTATNQTAANPATTGTGTGTSAAADPAAAARSKEQAMAALMALPELQAWSSRIEHASGGAAHGALIDYDAKLKLVEGKRYFQISYVENSRVAARRWESFLVAETGDQILVEDNATDQAMTLAQWRAAKRPIERTAVD